MLDLLKLLVYYSAPVCTVHNRVTALSAMQSSTLPAWCDRHSLASSESLIPEPVPLFPQFGHLFAKGDTRDAAIRNMVVALKEVAIRGEIRTSVDYTLDMLQVGYSHGAGGVWPYAASQVWEVCLLEATSKCKWNVDAVQLSWHGIYPPSTRVLFRSRLRAEPRPGGQQHPHRLAGRPHRRQGPHRKAALAPGGHRRWVKWMLWCLSRGIREARDAANDATVVH